MLKQFLSTLLIVLSFLTACYGQQRVTAYLEPPLYQTESSTIRFLTSAAGGKKPQVVQDGRFRSYSLEGPSFHIEYKIAGDTCVAAMVRFQWKASLYNQTVQQLMKESTPFGENRLKQTRSGKLIYVLQPREHTITAICYSYARRSIGK